ncbi:MAG: hypothetical protein QM813_21815 [Verrucomicrobiota bacterium]
MNLDHLQKKLLAAAKAHPPTDRVPLAFEKRVLAHLNAKPALDLASLWSRALWRATVPCLALTLVLVGLALYPAGNSSATATVTTAATDDLTTVFEQTLLASSDQLGAIDFLEEN